MSYSEFLRWFDFYQMNPFDDLHRYHRPAALVASSMCGEEVDKLVQWLHPDYAEQAESEYSEADLQTFKALGMMPPKRS